MEAGGERRASSSSFADLGERATGGAAAAAAVPGGGLTCQSNAG